MPRLDDLINCSLSLLIRVPVANTGAVKRHSLASQRVEKGKKLLSLFFLSLLLLLSKNRGMQISVLMLREEIEKRGMRVGPDGNSGKVKVTDKVR